MDADTLVNMQQDLDAGGKRRFWLITEIVEKHGIEDVVRIATLLENFITNVNLPSNVQSGATEKAATVFAPYANADPSQPANTRQVECDLVRTPFRPDRPEGRRPFFDEATREKFVQAAAENVDNQQLARQFSITVRQAHAIRVGLSKRIAKIRGNGRDPHQPVWNPASQKVSALSRSSELAMQEAFLREKPPAKKTMDDVVRFLRQRDDSVTFRDGNYIVNLHLTLTPQQLVERANKKRHERGETPFQMEEGALQRQVVNDDTSSGGGDPLVGSISRNSLGRESASAAATY